MMQHMNLGDDPATKAMMSSDTEAWASGGEATSSTSPPRGHSSAAGLSALVGLMSALSATVGFFAARYYYVRQRNEYLTINV
jgi:hypothetical protein